MLTKSLAQRGVSMFGRLRGKGVRVRTTAAVKSGTLHNRYAFLMSRAVVRQEIKGLAGGGRRNFCSDSEKETVSFNVQDYEDFNERVLNADRPVIVDFHADWCGPCKMLGPRLEELVDGREGRVLLAKVNIDDNQDLAIDYGVRAVPTVQAYVEGEKAGEFVGMVEDERITALLNNVLNEDH